MEPAQYSLTFVIIVAAVLFLLGLGVGVLYGRRTSPAAQRQREAERKLDQLLQDKKAYEDEVVEHFTETATLLNDLTDRYRQVHNHLAKGASNLCQGRGPVSLENIARREDPSEIPAQLADIRQPLDYAPKTSPAEKGMLAEEFGIERKKAARSPEREEGRAAADSE